MMDPYADASIGNVTGSNSINVFMGIGIAWVVAACYWQSQSSISSEWLARFGKLDTTQQQNVRDGMSDLTKPVFIAPGGTIWFNLMVFCINAFFALGILYARRRRFG